MVSLMYHFSTAHINQILWLNLRIGRLASISLHKNYDKLVKKKNLETFIIFLSTKEPSQQFSEATYCSFHFDTTLLKIFHNFFSLVRNSMR